MGRRTGGAVLNRRYRHMMGAAAEELAVQHLTRRGCRLLARRFRSRGGELDLVVEDNGVLAFVEVKARSGVRYGLPSEAVTRGKQRRIVRAARGFVSAERLRGRRCRFDVICVTVRAGQASVAWLRDAYRP